MASCAGACLTVSVMHECRAVDADADLNVAGQEEVTPRLIDRHGVRLQRLHDLRSPDIVAPVRSIDAIEDALVESNRHGQWFAGMPTYRKTLPDERTLENAAENRVDEFRVELVASFAIG